MHAVAGYLAGYSGTTLEAYRLDLRQSIGWLDTAGLDPFMVERAHIELYSRWCESQGTAHSTIGRQLSTVCGFYRYCSQERIIDRGPRRVRCAL
ncbi:site-specific integrase [Ilumatobacter sp.]|uniref:site-specific integrase n=1 Tax=Ilumatobacter sp. TaxID=1967498 RepID=UPI003C3FE01A